MRDGERPTRQRSLLTTAGAVLRREDAADNELPPSHRYTNSVSFCTAIDDSDRMSLGV